MLKIGKNVLNFIYDKNHFNNAETLKVNFTRIVIELELKLAKWYLSIPR